MRQQACCTIQIKWHQRAVPVSLTGSWLAAVFTPEFGVDAFCRLAVWNVRELTTEDREQSWLGLRRFQGSLQ